jgi:hypothetical protein
MKYNDTDRKQLQDMFKKLCRILNILTPIFCLFTSLYVAEIIKFIEKIVQNGYGYMANSQVDESNTGSDRNPGCGTTNESNGKIIITPHLITIHLIGTMGCSFTQLSDANGSDCRIQSDFNTMDLLMIPPNSDGATIGSVSDSIRSDYRF